MVVVVTTGGTIEICRLTLFEAGLEDELEEELAPAAAPTVEPLVLGYPRLVP